MIAGVFYPMAFFTDCYTPDELRKQYLYWAKVLHPDKGGDKVDFQRMQNEYEDALNTLKNNQHKPMPQVFDARGNYEYFRRKVRYVGTIYGHYYKFIQDIGADILIDINHIQLIYSKPKYL